MTEEKEYIYYVQCHLTLINHRSTNANLERGIVPVLLYFLDTNGIFPLFNSQHLFHHGHLVNGIYVSNGISIWIYKRILRES